MDANYAKHPVKKSYTFKVVKRKQTECFLQNYNKSRIYSNRGVKLLQIKLDDQVIFHGEIAKSSGELKGLLSTFGDVSLVYSR